MKVNQRIAVWRLKKELEKSKSININRVCNLLSQIRAYMSNVKEEYYDWYKWKSINRAIDKIN